MPHFRAVSSVPTFGWARGGAPGPVEQVPRASNGYYKANVRVCERQPRFSTLLVHRAYVYRFLDTQYQF